MAEGCREAMWLRSVLNELGFNQYKPTRINCDNQGSIKLAGNPETHQRTKHIDIKYHFLRERVNMGEISLKYVNTNDNLSDIFTKAIEHRRFTRLRDLLGLKS